MTWRLLLACLRWLGARQQGLPDIPDTEIAYLESCLATTACFKGLRSRPQGAGVLRWALAAG